MKKGLLFILLIFPTSILLGQNYKPAYGTPLIVLTETNPWLIVIGSDAPTFALYENGQILYKRAINKKVKYFEVKLSKDGVKQKPQC